jgi:hypothetical protein
MTKDELKHFMAGVVAGLAIATLEIILLNK